jgi:short-subunit dehydrogenase
MSSYSGEIGLIYRTGYCSSKFAVTGFFESLRMETQGSIDITIICPPTLNTNLRKNAIMFQHADSNNEE